MGGPIVRLPTGMHRGRYTAAAYRTMGLDECIAEAPEDYVRQAVELATNAEYRRSVVDKIVDRRHQLFDIVAAVRELEDTFERLIADANCAG